MPFIPHTDVEIQEMLAILGVNSIGDLFNEIPTHLQTAELNQIPAGLTEMKLTRVTEQRGQKNKNRVFALLARVPTNIIFQLLFGILLVVVNL